MYRAVFDVSQSLCLMKRVRPHLPVRGQDELLFRQLLDKPSRI